MVNCFTAGLAVIVLVGVLAEVAGTMEAGDPVVVEGVVDPAILL